MNETETETATAGDLAALHEQPAFVEQAREIARDVASVGRLDTATARNVLASIMGQFGGAEAFGAHIAGVLKDLSKTKPLRPGVAAALLTVVKLQAKIDGDSRRDRVEELTNEQIERELMIASIQRLLGDAADPARRAALEHVLQQRGLALVDTRAAIETPNSDTPTAASSDMPGDCASDLSDCDLATALRRLEAEATTPASLQR